MNASRSGSQPVTSASGTVTTSAPAKSAPRSYTGYAGSGIATSRRSPTATCANEKIASFDPSVGTISVAGSTETPNRRATHAATASRSSGSPVARGYEETSVMPATSASRMKRGVTSSGSPIPKSISSMPRRRASAFHSSSRVNGYCARSASTGESCIPRR